MIIDTDGERSARREGADGKIKCHNEDSSTGLKLEGRQDGEGWKEK